MSKTNISWADAVWNPATGCTKCSPGCLNCYAEVMAKRLKGMGQRKYRDGFQLTLHEQCLTEPLKWKKPQTIFVCSMSDLFHPDVPFTFLDKVFAVMASCPQHTFVLCTKRAERMRRYLSAPFIHSRVEAVASSMSTTVARAQLTPWPLPNVHLGVTVEGYGQLERFGELTVIPAVSRWLSLEPLLSGMTGGPRWNMLLRGGRISGVIIGCESGPNRRPFDLAWARQVRDDCEAAGVKLYVKQLIVDGKFTKNIEEFPADLRIQQLPWQTRKRGA